MSAEVSMFILLSGAVSEDYMTKVLKNVSPLSYNSPDKGTLRNNPRFS